MAHVIVGFSLYFLGGIQISNNIQVFHLKCRNKALPRIYRLELLNNFKNKDTFLLLLFVN